MWRSRERKLDKTLKWAGGCVYYFKIRISVTSYKQSNPTIGRAAHHVDNTGELEEEEGGVVRNVRVLRREKVDRPHVQVALLARPHPKLQLRAATGCCRQLPEVQQATRSCQQCCGSGQGWTRPGSANVATQFSNKLLQNQENLSSTCSS